MEKIVQNGAAILRDVAVPVPEELFGTSKLTAILTKMEKALDPEMEGVALAAPQIAIPYRIFLVRMDRTMPPPPMEEHATRVAPVAQNVFYINPKILKTSRKTTPMDEGCLSVRGVYGTTNRHERVTISARTPDGASIERGAGGLLAQIFEHEIDHLNGILFIDQATHLIEIKHDHE